MNQNRRILRILVQRAGQRVENRLLRRIPAVHNALYLINPVTFHKIFHMFVIFGQNRNINLVNFLMILKIHKSVDY